jgi:adenylyl- and sulfurtransferase ThiI
MYSELALRNRIDNRNAFEKTLDSNLNAVKDSRSLEYRYHLTVRQYVLTFKQAAKYKVLI